MSQTIDFSDINDSEDFAPIELPTPKRNLPANLDRVLAELYILMERSGSEFRIKFSVKGGSIDLNISNE